MKKIYIEVILAIAMVGIFGGALAISSFILKIPNTGRVGTSVQTSVTAKSGSVEDIQAAVNEAISKGIVNVIIPEGTFVFNASGIGTTAYNVKITVPAQGLNIFGAGIDRTVLDMPDKVTTPETIMFYIVGGVEVGGVWQSGGKLRISGITFKGRSAPNSATGDTALFLTGVKDFRVDHCSFWDIGSDGIAINDQDVQYGITQWPSVPNGGDPARISQGVVDHNYFYNMYKPASTAAGTGYGYGVAVGRAQHYLWTPWDDNIWNVLGVYDKNVFIEDNYFTGARHAVASSNGGVYVFRYNIVEDIGESGEASTTGHPVRQDYYGMRATENYNNIYRRTTAGTIFGGIMMKGGGGVIFNNTIQNLDWAFELGNAEWRNTFYPRGNLKDCYLWNNTLIGIATPYYVIDGGPDGAPAPVENADYFLYEPPASANYRPYPYPHPLTLGEVQDREGPWQQVIVMSLIPTTALLIKPLDCSIRIENLIIARENTSLNSSKSLHYESKNVD